MRFSLAILKIRQKKSLMRTTILSLRELSEETSNCLRSFGTYES